MYNVQAEKQQLSPEHIAVVIDFIVMLIGQQLTEQDLRKVFREGNFAGIAQSDLSPLLREMRDSFKTSPAARLTDLAVLLPKEISLPILALAENTHQMLMRTKHAAKNDVAEELRNLKSMHDEEVSSLRSEIELQTGSIERLNRSLDVANGTNRTLTERLNQLEREKTLLEGRLLEREKVKPPEKGAAPKKSEKKKPAGVDKKSSHTTSPATPAGTTDPAETSTAA